MVFRIKKNDRSISGFTLVEVLMAVMLVGIAVASVMSANAAFTRANIAGTELSEAEILIEEIRELSHLRDYEQLYDLDGSSFCPPVNSRLEAMDGLGSFRQEVFVENVDRSDLEIVVPDGESGFLRVGVKVYRRDRLVSSSSWIRTIR